MTSAACARAILPHVAHVALGFMAYRSLSLPRAYLKLNIPNDADISELGDVALYRMGHADTDRSLGISRLSWRTLIHLHATLRSKSINGERLSRRSYQWPTIPR